MDAWNSIKIGQSRTWKFMSKTTVTKIECPADYIEKDAPNTLLFLKDYAELTLYMKNGDIYRTEGRATKLFNGESKKG